jgi:hypothetical protein
VQRIFKLTAVVVILVILIDDGNREPIPQQRVALVPVVASNRNQ